MKDLVIDKDNIINELINALDTNEYNKELIDKCFKIITGNNLDEFIIEKERSFGPGVAPIIHAMHRTIGRNPSKGKERKAQELYNLFTNN